MDTRATWRDISAALWAMRAQASTRRGLRTHRVDTIVVRPAPRLSLDATRGVTAALRYSRATCLQSSLVLQRWYADHGVERDLVMGVTPMRSGFRAHAWLEEPGQMTEQIYVEINRLPAKGVRLPGGPRSDTRADF